MPYIIRVRVPGVPKPLTSDPMPLAQAAAAERVLKRRHGVGVEVKHVEPAIKRRDTLDGRLQRVAEAAARRAS